MTDSMLNDNTSGISRRSFLTGMGVATAGVAAAVATGASAEEAVQAPVEEFPGTKLSIGHIEFNPDLCAGCRVCEIVCSLAHFDTVSTELSSIRINTDVLGGYISTAEICKQCPGAECLAACPTGALHVDPATGARVIDAGVCIGCQSCVKACPLEPARPHFYEEGQRCFKCDLCGGDPWCVKCCSGGALKCSWVEEEADPTIIATDTGVVVDYDLTGSIMVIAPESQTVSAIYTALDSNALRVGGHIASTYTQPYTCKIKTTYFDTNGQSLFQSDRLEFEVEVGGEGDFEDIYEADDPSAVSSIRLEIMCGKIAG